MALNLGHGGPCSAWGVSRMGLGLGVSHSPSPGGVPGREPGDQGQQQSLIPSRSRSGYLEDTFLDLLGEENTSASSSGGILTPLCLSWL